MTHIQRILLPAGLALLVATSAGGSDLGHAISVKGSVIDSACAFTKGLHKPISPECAARCAKAGSALVILSDNGDIYLPISEKTPASGQNERLLPFAGRRVHVTGKAYQRGGAMAVVIEKISLETDKK